MLERFPLKPYPAWIKVKNLVSLQRKLDLAHKLKMSCSQITQGKSFWSKYQLCLWLTQHSHSPTPNLQLDLYPQHMWGEVSRVTLSVLGNEEFYTGGLSETETLGM